MTDILFRPLQLGALQLPNRVIMPPLTRMRAADAGAPGPLNAEYYAQRASAGLIVTEATAISPQGHGYPNMPGVHTSAQIAGWRTVTDAVHAQGGRIVLQLVHHGRWSHSGFMPDGSLPVAPSAIAAEGKIYTKAFEPVDFEVPRALELDELPTIIADFRQAALNGLEAGFDAIEVHGANGFLLDQFLQNGSNRRTDSYGGSVENRSRLLMEVLDAVVDAVGAERTALRLSPHGNLGGVSDDDVVGLFSYVIGRINRLGLAYLHLIEPRASSAGLGDDASVDAADNARLFGGLFDGPVISAGGYTRQSAMERLAAGEVDAIAFGRAFIANPDLPARLANDMALNSYDRSTFYGGGAAGYTDYPRLATA